MRYIIQSRYIRRPYPKLLPCVRQRTCSQQINKKKKREQTTKFNIFSSHFQTCNTTTTQSKSQPSQIHLYKITNHSLCMQLNLNLYHSNITKKINFSTDYNFSTFTNKFSSVYQGQPFYKIESQRNFTSATNHQHLQSIAGKILIGNSPIVAGAV